VLDLTKTFSAVLLLDEAECCSSSARPGVQRAGVHHPAPARILPGYPIPSNEPHGDLRQGLPQPHPRLAGSALVGWGSDLQDEVPDAEKLEARRHGSWEHQEASLAVLPDQDGALSVWAVHQLVGIYGSINVKIVN